MKLRSPDFTSQSSGFCVVIQRKTRLWRALHVKSSERIDENKLFLFCRRNSVNFYVKSLTWLCMINCTEALTLNDWNIALRLESWIISLNIQISDSIKIFCWAKYKYQSFSWRSLSWNIIKSNFPKRLTY